MSLWSIKAGGGGEKERINLSSDHLCRSISPSHHLASYLERRLLVVVLILRWDWFMDRFLHPNTPSGKYEVHAKFELIYIWANPSALVISAPSLICLLVCKQEGCEGYTIGWDWGFGLETIQPDTWCGSLWNRILRKLINTSTFFKTKHFFSILSDVFKHHPYLYWELLQLFFSRLSQICSYEEIQPMSHKME